jgi:hypothetical protein
VFPFEGKLRELSLILASDIAAFWALGLLINNPPTFTLATELGDIDEATFSGYGGEQALTGWGDIYTYAARDKASDATALVWSHSGGGVANVVTGWYITDTDGDRLIYVEAFDTPKVMAIFGDVISLLPTVVLGKLLP